MTPILGADKSPDPEDSKKRKRKSGLSISPVRYTPENVFSSRMEERREPNKPLRPIVQEGAFTIYGSNPRGPQEKAKVIASSDREEKEQTNWQKMRAEKRRRRKKVMSGIKKVGSVLGDIFS